MNQRESQSRKVTTDTSEIIVYECDCNNRKQIRVVYDGGFNEKFTVEYCQDCYELESKKFEISMEVIS
ncbi:hypothetical protein [Nitrosarchaeum sp.]|uniref:hypothetical protein n=1 Tax=Nitrosarchaeum sp. TaxID=2026886 RepID=UPI00247E2464|nr:hypothetical protein [Nitrosarchaeum sp.]MCV0412197.1 hypothetical protein [Nitrosarchaeum sp.]